MSLSVKAGADGRHEVLDGDRLVGSFATSQAAWREVDRLENAPVNKAQATSDWIASKILGGDA